MNKVLIIGGNGYIGSKLYNLIDADSIDLCLFGKDLGYSRKINYGKFNEYSQYDIIILLAGHSSVRMCEYNKSNAWVNNVDYFYSLCEKLNKNQLLIYASSGSVYGQKLSICDEHDINLDPINHYDLTKVTIDIIANKFILEDKNIIGLRFGTVNGDSENIRSDLMINAMVYNHFKNGKIQISNEWIKRPILSTNDLTRAIIQIIGSERIICGQYNLCSFNSTVFNIANAVKEVLGSKIEKLPPSDKVYDFEIKNSKFCTIYNFSFQDTIYDIINSMTNSPLEIFDTRNEDRLFNSCL